MTSPKPIQFHWRLMERGEPEVRSRSGKNIIRTSGTPDFKAQLEFCKLAEEAGINSLLTAFSFSKPDPTVLGGALLTHADQIKFLIAMRAGIISPTYFTQQINTFSALTNGRVSLNLVAGHSPKEQAYYGDFLSREDRYARMEEFLAVCHAFWAEEGPVNFEGQFYQVKDGLLNSEFISDTEKHPYIFISGSSDTARALTIKYGSCWMQFPNTPEKVEQLIQPVLAAGKEVGLRFCVIARPTREEALQAASDLISDLDNEPVEKGGEKKLIQESDANSFKRVNRLAESEWLTPYLWTTPVKYFGPATQSLVGTPDDIANAILEYIKIGVTQFILSGWPKLDEMVYFGKEVLPIIREKEKNLVYV